MIQRVYLILLKEESKQEKIEATIILKTFIKKTKWRWRTINYLYRF